MGGKSFWYHPNIGWVVCLVSSYVLILLGFFKLIYAFDVPEGANTYDPLGLLTAIVCFGLGAICTGLLSIIQIMTDKEDH